MPPEAGWLSPATQRHLGDSGGPDIGADFREQDVNLLACRHVVQRETGVACVGSSRKSGGMRREVTWVCVAGAIALAGCGNSVPTASTKDTGPSSGVLRGAAAECAGPARLPAHPVQVIVYRGSQVVVRQTKMGTHNFRFTLPPGRYKVTTNQSAAFPVTVTLRAGGTANAVVGSGCD